MPPQQPGYGYPGYPPPPPGYTLRPVAPDGRPLAGFGDRLVAFIVDSLIMGAVSSIFWIPALVWWFRQFADKMTTLSNSYQPNDEIPPSFFGDLLVGYLVLFAVVIVVTMLVSYVYLVEMSWKGGQTIGKRMMKLQVAPVEPGTERTRMMFVKRWAVERVGGVIVPFFSYLDGLWQLWDKPLQQCLHDKVAATVVVKIG